MPHRDLEQCFPSEAKCSHERDEMAQVLARQRDEAEPCAHVREVFCFHNNSLPASTPVHRTHCASTEAACNSMRDFDGLTAGSDDRTTCTGDREQIRQWFAP
jgi:hypothetical protein